MIQDYKTKIYKNYVSNHTKTLYGNISIDRIESQFKVWDYYYYDRILKSLDKNIKILEIGCGNGSFIHYLKQKGFKNLRGIDLSEEYINEGLNLGIQEIKIADLYDEIGINNQKYDLIIARDVIEHFKHEEVYNILELIFQSLTVNGKFLFQVPNGEGLFSRVIFYSDFTHELLFTKNSVNQIAKSIGFTQSISYGTGPVPYHFFSFIRYFFWKLICIIVNIIYKAETGFPDLILSQNIIVVLSK